MTPKKHHTRAAIYARPSVSDSEGIGIQLEKAHALAGSRDFEVVHEYIDYGVSGYKARRGNRVRADARRRSSAALRRRGRPQVRPPRSLALRP